MSVKNGLHPALAMLGVIAFVTMAVTLILQAPSAEAEPYDLYEVKQISTTHGAKSVAVRADGAEVLMLESVYDSKTTLYTNTILCMVRGKIYKDLVVRDAYWYWTRVAYDPSSTEALLGGSQGVLWSYDNGVIIKMGVGNNEVVTAIDWHPTEGYAFVGTSEGTVYLYNGSRLIRVVDYPCQVYDIDFAPDGSEAAFACYGYFYIYNTTRGDYETIREIAAGDDVYTLVFATEYSADGHLYAAWEGGSTNALFRQRDHNWDLVAPLAGVGLRMVFEPEGSFIVCVTNSKIVVVEGTKAQVIKWSVLNPSGGSILDIAVNNEKSYFIFGNEACIFEYTLKPDIAPWLKAPVADASFNEDDAPGGLHLINLLTYVTDDRSVSRLGFEIDFQSDPDNLMAIMDGHYINFVQRVPDWNGYATFRVKVIDRGYDNLPGTSDDNVNHTNYFNVTVRPVNDPFSLVKVGDLDVGEHALVFFVSEGQVIELPIEVFDVDRDVLSFSFNRSLPSMKVIAPATPGDDYVLWFQPRNKDVGELYIRMKASDGMGSTDRADLVFHIRNVNNPPRLMGVRDMSVDEDSWLNFTVWAIDEDIEIGIDDRLLFDTNRTDGSGDDDLPNFGFAIACEDPLRIMVHFLPTDADVGNVTVQFRVRDSHGATDTWDDMRSMTITVTNTNDAPRFMEVNGVSTEGLDELHLKAIEDHHTTINITATDDDDDPLTFYTSDSRFKLEQIPGAVTSRLSFSPTNDEVGTMSVIVSVWDNHNTFNQLRIDLTVENVNDPPVIQTFEARTVDAQTRLEFTLWQDQEFIAPLVVVDVDSDALTFSETVGVFTITVDPTYPHRAIYRWTPRQEDVGTRTTTVSVDDGDGGMVALILILDVRDINDPPSGTTITQEGSENTVTLLATPATDADGDALTYVWDFGDFTPTVSGQGLTQVTHTYARGGNFLATVTVLDGNGGQSVSTVDVFVLRTGEEENPVEVQKGPVGLTIGLTAVVLVAAVAMMGLYLRQRRRAGGAVDGGG